MSVRKRGNVLPNEYKEKALSNGLALTTVYARLKRGWNIDEAVSIQPTEKTSTHELKRDKGWLVANRAKGSSITFAIYQDLEDLFNKALQESGVTKSQFVADAVEQYLLKWQSNN
ncbi:hypothetical protein GM3708_2033 [Geminocystis sp. NIES-3708]|uniref:hypothetical protein n=1 Tax=Geminocystis sp. NIES-3708 TaxID=1615909 RepID=UPI0005FCC4C6|nr:hypothetical protein [Geminocystis sp. NIES-3708]BAQ61627.1 hypothetical protein GM3708_2033 [Geminocystis sp. NIES-3708]